MRRRFGDNLVVRWICGIIGVVVPGIIFPLVFKRANRDFPGFRVVAICQGLKFPTGLSPHPRADVP